MLKTGVIFIIYDYTIILYFKGDNIVPGFVKSKHFSGKMFEDRSRNL